MKTIPPWEGNLSLAEHKTLKQTQNNYYIVFAFDFYEHTGLVLQLIFVPNFFFPGIQ